MKKPAPSVGPLAADLEGNQGVAAGFRILGIRDFHFPALAFGVFHIHPVQVARKNVAFVTPGLTARPWQNWAGNRAN